MIPETNKALLDLAMQLALEVAPATTNEYTAASTSLIAVLLQLFAQESERGVEVLWQDIQALKTLFRECPPVPLLSSEMETFCSREPASLTLSDMTQVHTEGMGLLIRLHTHVETNLADFDKTNHAIWRFLQQHSKRHSYAVSM